MKYEDLVWPSSMPYDTLKIVDNSVYSDMTNGVITGIPTGPIAYIPFVSERGYGEDKTLVYINSSRIGKYGKPNLNKFGFSLYLANQFLNGGGTVLGMRVLPKFKVVNKYQKVESGGLTVVDDTATPEEYQIRVSDVTPATQADAPVVGDHVKLTTVSCTGPSYANMFVGAIKTTTTIKYVVGKVDAEKANGEDPAVYFNNTTTTASDLGITVASGETFYKLFIIKTKAAGEFGKNFNISFTSDSTMNSYAKSHDWSAYFYRFSDNESGSPLDADMSFTFADGITYDSTSMDPEDVFDTYSENVAFTKGADINAFFNIDAANINPGVDFLFADSLGSWTIDSTKLKNALKLDGACPLFDSSFSWDNDPFADIIAGAYGYERAESSTAAAITRVTDLVYDEIRYPFQYLFVPSYNSTVVTAARDLMSKRDISHPIYVFPKYDTFSLLRNYLIGNESPFKGVTDWREHMIPEWGYYRDPYSGKKTLFPVQFELAKLMPNHWISHKGTPYAGISNFALNEYVTGTIVPHTILNAELISNHNARINTLVENGLGSAVPYEQITAYTATSALSECNNSFILTDMIRIAKRIADEKRWTNLDADTIEDYKNSVQNAIKGELGSCYSSMEVVATRESVNGAGRNRIKCAITVYFKDILKGISYVFYIAASNS